MKCLETKSVHKFFLDSCPGTNYLMEDATQLTIIQ